MNNLKKTLLIALFFITATFIQSCSFGMSGFLYDRYFSFSGRLSATIIPFFVFIFACFLLKHGKFAKMCSVLLFVAVAVLQSSLVLDCYNAEVAHSDYLCRSCFLSKDGFYHSLFSVFAFALFFEIPAIFVFLLDKLGKEMPQIKKLVLKRDVGKNHVVSKKTKEEEPIGEKFCGVLMCLSLLVFLCFCVFILVNAVFGI